MDHSFDPLAPSHPRAGVAPGTASLAVRRTARIRIGAVQYLNTRPLVHRLAAAPATPVIDSPTNGMPSAEKGPASPTAGTPVTGTTDPWLCYDLPSRLADRLARGELDVALIPVIELFRGDSSLISDACIACDGPVMSVKLFFRTRPENVRRLALDEGSRTSAGLARILLAERFSVRPSIEPLPIGEAIEDTDADAVLLIGDRALEPVRGSFQLAWDLGDEWCRWTGLPFVFAVWAARRDLRESGVDLVRLKRRLEEARDSGLANLAAIAAAEAAGHGLTVPQCLGYLRDNLHYHLGAREREAVDRFRELAVRHGLAPAGEPVE